MSVTEVDVNDLVQKEALVTTVEQLKTEVDQLKKCGCNELVEQKTRQIITLLDKISEISSFLHRGQ